VLNQQKPFIPAEIYHSRVSTKKKSLQLFQVIVKDLVEIRFIGKEWKITSKTKIEFFVFLNEEFLFLKKTTKRTENKELISFIAMKE